MCFTKKKGYIICFFLNLCKEIIKDINPDFLDINQFLPQLIYPKLKAKTFFTVHDIYLWYGILFWLKFDKKRIPFLFPEFFLLRKYKNLRPNEFIITPSFSTYKKLLKFKIKKGKITIIPNGIDFFQIYQIAKNIKKENKIVYVGRLIKYKRVDLALEIFDEFRKKNKAEFHIVYSGGEQEKEIKKLALGLKDVFFHKKIDEYEKFKLIASAFALINPSLCEGQGIVLLEALCCNTPVVVSDIPPFREIIKNQGEGGFLFKNKKEAIDFLENCIRNHQKIISSNFGMLKPFLWEDITNRYKKICISGGGVYHFCSE